MRHSSLAQCLLFVACRNPVVPRFFPVLGTFGQPFEPMARDLLKGLTDVVFNVSGHTENGTGFQDFRQGLQMFGGHETATMMPGFWPRIRIKQEGAVNRPLRQHVKDITAARRILPNSMATPLM